VEVGFQRGSYCEIELATAENALFAVDPMSRIVPTTTTRMTASITAYSAMSCASSCNHNLRNRLVICFTPLRSHPKLWISLPSRNSFLTAKNSPIDANRQENPPAEPLSRSFGREWGEGAPNWRLACLSQQIPLEQYSMNLAYPWQVTK